MPRFIEKGHGPPTPVMEAFAQNDCPPRVADVFHQSTPKPSGFQLPNIFPTKALIAKDKLPDGINRQ
jgi:hypothetical protein